MTITDVVKAICAAAALISAVLIMIWIVLLQICAAIDRLKHK